MHEGKKYSWEAVLLGEFLLYCFKKKSPEKNERNYDDKIVIPVTVIPPQVLNFIRLSDFMFFFSC